MNDFLDKIWQERFKKGMELELFVGSYLLSQGLCVYIPEKKNRPSYKNGKNFGDAYDMRVYNKRGLVYFLEIKSQKHEWTGLDDFPFEDILVDNKDQWERKRGKIEILAHIFVSQPTGAMLVLGAASRQFWVIKDTYDYGVGGGHRLTIPKYTCHKSYLKPIEKLIQFIKFH